jgi:hypothetical protein
MWLVDDMTLAYVSSCVAHNIRSQQRLEKCLTSPAPHPWYLSCRKLNVTSNKTGWNVTSQQMKRKSDWNTREIDLFSKLVMFSFVGKMRDLIVWLWDERPKCRTVPYNLGHVVTLLEPWTLNQLFVYIWKHLDSHWLYYCPSFKYNNPGVTCSPAKSLTC